jgi:hypothetical protein
MDEYEKLIVSAKEAGYKHITIREFYHLLKTSSLSTSDRYFIHRHDIDTDIKTARLFFEIEKKHQVLTSYYFRLSTFDAKLIKEIDEAGFEVGYHFEELSEFCKQYGIKKSSDVPSHFDTIANNFKTNCSYFEEKSKIKIKSVAAHGDFVNRVINMPNNAFITTNLLNSLGIEFECYDELLIKNYNYIGSDTIYPNFYRPSSPFEAILKDIPVIYFLSHPRHWRSNIIENLTDNINRFKEGRSYNRKKGR